MKKITIKRGYDIPLAGSPAHNIEDISSPGLLAIAPGDFKGTKPALMVKTNDYVKIGSPIFHDKKRPELLFVSPAAGRIIEIVYGPRRIIEKIVISSESNDALQHHSYRPDQIARTPAAELIELMHRGGVWPLIRQRPFNRIASPEHLPSSVFINCMNTAPAGAPSWVAMQGKNASIQAGIDALKVISGGKKIHMAMGPQEAASDLATLQGVESYLFEGPHPAGLVGTHIAHIDPLSGHKLVWYLNIRDVALLGDFLLVGHYPTERIIAVAGPAASEPHLFRTRQGVRPSDLLKSDFDNSSTRIISGNVLTGKKIGQDGVIDFYTGEITLVKEARDRHLLGWMMPGLNKASSSRTFLSGFLAKKQFPVNTSNNGEKRAFVMTGRYRDVVALDIYPDFLARAVLTEDIEMMEKLGILECDPEDVALCSYICPSKIEFTEIIDRGLDMVEKELE